MDSSNYRPISLLPLISKIFEKIVHDQMIDYLAQYNILYKYQSGFRTKHSTDLCLSYLNDKTLKGFDNGLFTRMVLIDLQKAFDTINHNILSIQASRKLRVVCLKDQFLALCFS